ncbi:UDP:flavonoid glycosyltransferase YjiC, YdhE family [Nitrosospira sp. Nsp18]|uniref:nucleotide disphospho-sugar-binding domain-containing protein n=1 Tax=Nitrosospira sp. Nsp18 TaxID=1855334 RepID=UPI00088C5D86|nr:glycosyltransferase [Nitrosospira sp. Nsp18]SDA22734.1 UDP:flavonoid glycosyltransferase YjiC, YdhE family [Nitrosospira sp. Nsp18]
MGTRKPVILLIAEAVTLAHFGRIATLAKALASSAYEIAVASDPRYIGLEPSLERAFHPIRSIPSAEFARALAQGKPLYSVETLTRYVEDDLTLLDKLKPDLVIGDFRLSLAVSAPLREIPYAAVVNAYWSPFASTHYPVPDLPMTRIVGVRLAQKLFDTVRPIAFAQHARPLNRVRRNYGLPPLGPDLRNAYTWGDYTLYADIPEMVPTCNLPANHQYLGPVLWSTHTRLPEWWDQLPDGKPVIFITLGSSGQASLLPMALEALSRLPATVIVATAGKIAIVDTPANAHITDYLPMDIATRRSRLVISNGGSLTTYQALAIGVPVIGLCSNMDQLLNMGAVERAGAGLTLRGAEISAADLFSAADAILGDSRFYQAASGLSRLLQQYDAGQRLREIVTEILAKKGKQSSLDQLVG